MAKNEQVRDDLNTADKVVRAVWDNFVATEPTYVLRDLIVIEIAKAREAEREACARIVETKWQEARDTEFDLGFETARKCFAAAIRSQKGEQG